MDPLRHLHRDIYRLGERGAQGVEIPVNHEKLFGICEELRPGATDVAFVPMDPTEVYLMPEGSRNIYFLPYLQLGEVIENEDASALIFRSAPGISFKDEFDVQEYMDRFNVSLDEQRALLLKRNFYTEIELETPEFSFERKAFPILWTGYCSDKELAYRVRAFKFVWEENLSEFVIQFDKQFVDPNEAREWKRLGNFFKLGLVFNVVLYTPHLWTNGMPATICFVKGFRIIDGLTGEVLSEAPSQVKTLKREHRPVKTAEEIVARIKKLLKIEWE